MYAWTTDGGEYQSEESEAIIKFDNQPPTVQEVVIEGTKGTGVPNAERWITSNGEIKITARDNPEGELAGYTYEVYNMSNVLQKKSNTIIPIERSIPVETDGEWKVIIKAVDKAGNESGEKLVNILKDETPPSVETPEISNITARGFTITVSAGDNISQVVKYVYNINGTSYEGDTTGIYEVSGLAPNTNYSVTVTVYNGAGLSSTSNNKPVKTGIGLQAPNINPTGSTQNGYYKETVTISLSEKVAGTGATKIKYKLNGGAEQTVNGTSGSFTITADGTHTIEAWTEDNDGNKSTSSNASVTKDTTGPTVTLTLGTATETTIPVTATATDTVSRNSKL